MRTLDENGIIPQSLIAWIESCVHPARRFAVFNGMLKLTKEDHSLPLETTYADLKRIADDKGYID